MTETAPQTALEPLDVFLGEWTMSPSPATDGTSDFRARTTFEWPPGGHFLLQRSEVDHPDVPDGIDIIGFDADRSIYLQRYFDSRGIARVYEMAFADGVWQLWRM